MTNVKTNTRSKKLRFSLRTLLIATTLLAVWLGYLTNRANTQRRAVEMIRSHVGAVVYSYQYDKNLQFAVKNPTPSGPAWLRTLLGRDYFDTVVAVRFNARSPSLGPPPLITLSDNDVELLASLPSLIDIGFLHVDLTDAQLARLSHFKQLKVLVLRNTSVTDDGLQTVAGFTKMQFLVIDGGRIDGMVQQCSRITDRGIAQLSGLTDLQQLDLDGTRLTDAGLAQIPPSAKLKRLGLEATDVTDAGLASLARFPSLDRLNLTNTAVTDAGMPSVAAIASLKSLRLMQTAVSDEGLAKFVALRLTDLDLEDAPQVTYEGYLQFTRANPAKVDAPQFKGQLQNVLGPSVAEGREAADTR